MKAVAFHTLGCKVNQYETEAITEQFLSKGYKVVEFNEIADIYIINTCTVTNIADKKSRKMLAKAKKLNNEAIVVAVGCYVQIAHDKLEDALYIDILIGNTHKNEVVSIVEDYIKTHQRIELIENVQENLIYEELTIDMQHSKTRSTIKIQDGCNQYCTYCIIPYTRGKIRSRSFNAVIEEVTRLVVNDYKEIILTGIHLGSYGKDLNDVTLIKLIEKLDKIKGLRRIRIGSLEPNFITRELLERLSRCKTVCDHFHLSMQSGSDSVLNRMKRHYNTKEYYEKVLLLREYYKNPSLTTDIIVGFPMETREEENETYEFVQKVEFADLHVFKYSIRGGTKAAEMKPQISGILKSDRSKRLTKLGGKSRQEYLTCFIGLIKEVLFEEETLIDGEPYYIGHTTNYIKVYVPKTSDLKIIVGEIFLIKLTKLYKDGLATERKLQFY